MLYPRCRPRIPVGYLASIQSDAGAGEGMLYDLSATGCRIQSAIAMSTGTYLALEIGVPQEPEPLAVEVSVVRWYKDGQCGIEFLRFGQGDRERVTNLVEAPAIPPTIVTPTHAEPLFIAAST